MKITAKTFKGTIEEIGDAATLLWFPPAQEMHTVVEDYATMALRRKNQRWSFMDLQLHLIISLSMELNTLKFLENNFNPDGQANELRTLKQITRTTINALIQVANGMAYRFLDYNMALTQLLHSNDTSPFSILDKGFSNAMELAANNNDIGNLNTQVLICDINSITNIGDYIVKEEDYFEIVEVKSGKKSRGSRLSRQKKRMSEVVDFINRENGFIDDKKVELIKLPTRNTQIDVLKECFDKTMKCGTAYKQINDYQIVSCINIDTIDRKCYSDSIKSLKSEISNIWGNDRTIEISSLDQRQHSGLTVPFTVYPLETSTIVDILMGKKIFISTINIDSLISYIESKGWKVLDLLKANLNKDKIKELDFSIFILYKNKLENNASFPIDALLSCATEMVNVDSYLDFCDKIISVSTQQRHWLPYYENEDHIWQ